MNYKEFKAVLAKNGITPSKSLLDITIDSMVNAGPEALKHITGFSSKEELLSNKNESELASLIESLFDDIASERDSDLESMTGFETIEEFLNHDPRATDEDIRRTEKELGVKLPAEFIQLHKEFGNLEWAGFLIYKSGDGYNVELNDDTPGFHSLKWGKNGFCGLVAEQENWNWQGRFVKIGYFNEEVFNRDVGHFGFLVTDGICEDGVSWLDHEYGAYENLEDCAGWIDDIIGFVLGEVNEKYRTVNSNGDDFDDDDLGDDDFEEENEESELVKAVISGDVLLINKLLDEGAEVNSVNEHGNTALKYATGIHIEAVRILLQRGADVNIEDEDGDTALDNAAYRGFADIISLLIEHQAGVNHMNHSGYTALMVAAWQGQIEAVGVLLKHGAEVNTKNDDGGTALSLASTDEIKKLLIDAGAKSKN